MADPEVPVPTPIDHEQLAQKLALLAEEIAKLQGMLASHQAYVRGAAPLVVK